MLKQKTVLFFALWLWTYLVLSQGIPLDHSHPKSQVEYITDNAQDKSKPNIVPVTRPPLIVATPPPPHPNSKSFSYDPHTNTWTLIKKGDPQPSEDTLLWNQSNDKWLTGNPQ